MGEIVERLRNRSVYIPNEGDVPKVINVRFPTSNLEYVEILGECRGGGIGRHKTIDARLSLPERGTLHTTAK